MPRSPRITGRDLVGALCRLGFEVRCLRGSHVRLRGPTGRVVVVPVHVGRIIGAGLLAAILRQAGVSHEDLRDAL